MKPKRKKFRFQSRATTKPGREVNMRPKTAMLRRLVLAVGVVGAVIGWSAPSDARIQKIVIDQTANVMLSSIPLGTSVPGPRHPIRYIRAGYSVHSPRTIAKTASSPISTMRPRQTAKSATLPTFRSSRRRIRERAVDS
jgi:hypothetical protein